MSYGCKGSNGRHVSDERAVHGGEWGPALHGVLVYSGVVGWAWSARERARRVSLDQVWDVFESADLSAPLDITPLTSPPCRVSSTGGSFR
jgi:hypothetical protein